MGRLFTFILGLAVGGAGVYGAQRYHVVRTADGFETVPKITSTFEDTYVDVRQFGVADWANHKMLAAAIAHGKQDHIFTDATAQSVHQQFGNLIEGLRQ